MLALMVTIKIKPGHHDAFMEAMMGDARGSAYDEPRCLRFDVVQDANDLNTLHFLQSCQHGARVLDEYSTDTTAPQLWGRVSGGPPSDGPASGEPDATGARRPAWLVDNTKPAELWRCASHLSRAE